MGKLQEFTKLASSAGIILIVATIAAIICKNTNLNYYYDSILHTNLAIIIGEFEIQKPLLLWINEGMMAIFFFFVGLELKREFVHGYLSHRENIAFPAFGAIGGMIVPALIFAFFNRHNELYIHGWAIPAATDIAFSIGILSLCSNKVPKWAKLFLLSLAIFDDVGAVLIIAIYYTEHISNSAITFALITIFILFAMNRFKVRRINSYVIVGLFLWVAVLKSGVHATLAGIIISLFIPIGKKTALLEKELHPWVAFGILPIFAFANAGVEIINLNVSHISHPITMGSLLGLFIGKPLGIMLGFAALLLIYRQRPKNVQIIELCGVSILAGIGFTMSLFIATLAYGHNNIEYMLHARMGILIGSGLSGILGYAILRHTFNKKR